MTFRSILANACLVLINITIVYGFPVPPALSEASGDSAAEEPVQQYRKDNVVERKKSKGSKIELTMEEWQKVMNSFSPETLRRIDQNRYGFTGAPDDIPVDILREIIENHFTKYGSRKKNKGTSNLKKPIQTRKGGTKEAENSQKAKSKHSNIGVKINKNKKQAHLDLTTESPKSELRLDIGNIATKQKHVDIDSIGKVEPALPTTVKDENLTDDLKVIEIVAYPTSYTTSSMSSTTATSFLSSSSTLSLSTSSYPSSSTSASSESTITLPSSTSSLSSTSSHSSLIPVTSTATSTSSSTHSLSSASTISASSTRIPTQSSLTATSSRSSSTSSLYLTSSSLILSSLYSSVASSSNMPFTPSGLSSSTTSSFSSSLSSTPSHSSTSSLPKMRILHINLVQNKINEND